MAGLYVGPVEFVVALGLIGAVVSVLVRLKKIDKLLESRTGLLEKIEREVRENQWKLEEMKKSVDEVRSVEAGMMKVDRLKVGTAKVVELKAEHILGSGAKST